MDPNIIALASIGLSAITAIATIFKDYHSLKKEQERLSAEIITKNRLQWIDKMRSLAVQYNSLIHDTYSEENLHKIESLIFEIRLMVGGRKKRSEYSELEKELISVLEKYKNRTTVIDTDALLQEFGKTIGNSYNRAKLEAGITSQRDETIAKEIYKTL